VFRPPRCPYRTCSQHHRPERGFCVRHGSYRVRCRSRPIPRFRCRTCRRTFSRQSFRADFGDKLPHVNTRVLESLASGIGLRQTARNLGLSVEATQRKFRKIARHLRRLQVNLQRPLGGARLELGELATWAGRRSNALRVPFLVEPESGYLVWAESSPAESEAGVRRTLERGARLGAHCARKGAFHVTGPVQAAARDSVARLRKHPGLASKQRRYLDLALQLWVAHRNLVRQGDGRRDAPAANLGLVARRLSPSEALGWRQDWGRASCHPLSRRGVPIA